MMSGGGSPDFFYREALRLGYVARSAFKVRLVLPSLTNSMGHFPPSSIDLTSSSPWRSFCRCRSSTS